MKAHTLLLICLATSSATSLANTDPVTSCREAHAADPQAHIACLETAVRDLTQVSESAAASAEAANSLGAEQVQQIQRASSENPKEPLAVGITSVSYNSQNLGIFFLDNGQVWRETEKTPRGQRLKPGRTYSAVIERGVVGGYRLYVEGSKRMLKIERLK